MLIVRAGLPLMPIGQTEDVTIDPAVSVYGVHHRIGLTPEGWTVLFDFHRILPAVQSHARRAGEAPEDLYSTGLNPPNFSRIRSWL
jgi:hypothetical protein